MTGMRGPAPKPANRRARRNKDPVATKMFEVLPVEPYALPQDLLPEGDEWHPATLRWWNRWCVSPLAAELPEVDWSELEIIAMLHHQFMKKRSPVLAMEMRQRISGFGATPIDRARLRYQVALADEKETEVSQGPDRTAKKRYGGLQVV